MLHLPEAAMSCLALLRPTPRRTVAAVRIHPTMRSPCVNTRRETKEDSHMRVKIKFSTYLI